MPNEPKTFSSQDGKVNAPWHLVRVTWLLSALINYATRLSYHCALNFLRVLVRRTIASEGRFMAKRRINGRRITQNTHNLFLPNKILFLLAIFPFLRILSNVYLTSRANAILCSFFLGSLKILHYIFSHLIIYTWL